MVTVPFTPFCLSEVAAVEKETKLVEEAAAPALIVYVPLICEKEGREISRADASSKSLNRLM